MPRYPAARLPDDWQPAKRANGWWLQYRQPDGSGGFIWRDYSGPYKQRGSAVQMFYRLERKWLQDVRRDPSHVHTYPDNEPPGLRNCTVCRLRENPLRINSGEEH